MKSKLAAVAVLLGAAGNVTAAESSAPEFMSGDWCARSGELRFDERWTAADGDRLFALTRNFKGATLTGFEFLRIEPAGQGYAFIAQPNGAPPTVFKQAERSDQRIAFVNPDNDFPQRVEYWRDADGLHAVISNPDASPAQSQRFDFAPGGCAEAAAVMAAKPQTMADVLAASKPGDWRRPDPQRTLYLDLASGRVVIELAPTFAPKHVTNIVALARSGYFDGLAILRVQDNFVAQWGDPNAEDDALRKPLKAGAATLPAEFTRPDSRDLDFTVLPDSDGWAPQTGFSDGFPAARDPAAGRAWLAHCYGALGVGRGNDANSGGGTELYVVIGHAPRQLDRNITVAGRVLQGMELLSSLPRGSGPLGFYEQASERVPIKSVRVAADVPEGQRTAIEVLRTDTPTFTALVEARRNRRDEWYKQPAGHIDVCSVPIPVRKVP